LANQSRRNDEGQSNSVKDEIARMHKNPRLGEWGSQGSAMLPFERAMVVSYKLSIVRIAL